jgi:hypothetical protein
MTFPGRISWARRTLIVAGTASAVLALGGCEGCGSSSNTSDRATPTLRWNVRNLETGNTQEFTGSGQISVNDNEPIRIVLKANAPGGVRLIRLSGEGAWVCHGGDVAQFMSVLQKTDESIYTTSQAPTYTFLIRETDLSGWECHPGFADPTGHFTFYGRAENFAGGIFGVAAGALTVCNTRGCQAR